MKKVIGSLTRSVFWNNLKQYDGHSLPDKENDESITLWMHRINQLENTKSGL